MLKKILIAFVSLPGLVLAVGLVLPTTYRVERSQLILAPSETVYAHVASPRRWREWAAWSEASQPGGTWTFGGPEEGVGAVRSWSGEGVGQGTLSLSEANPRTGVAYQALLDEGRATARGHLSLAPEEGGTRVTWVEEGRLGGGPLRGYLMPLVRARLGSGFEEGLGRLKRVAETAPAEVLPPETPEEAPGTTPVRAPPPAEPGAVATPEPAPAAVEDAGTSPVLVAEELPAPAAEPTLEPTPAPAPTSPVGADAGPSDGGLGDAGEPR